MLLITLTLRPAAVVMPFWTVLWPLVKGDTISIVSNSKHRFDAAEFLTKFLWLWRACMTLIGMFFKAC